MWIGKVFSIVVVVVVVIVVLLVTPNAVFCQDNPVENIDITNSVFILEDPSSNKSLKDILTLHAGAFKRTTSPRINFGITTSALWIKFRTPSGTDHVQLTSPNIHEVTLFATDKSGNFREIKTGFLSLFASRGNDIDRFTFEVKANQWHYLRIKSGHFLNTALLASSRPRILRESFHRAVFYSMYTGAMLIIAAYSLFFTIQDRKLYLVSYFGYVSSITTINLTEKGFLLQYMWPQHPDLNGFFPILPFGVSVCLLFFINDLFRIKKKIPTFFNFTLIGVIAIPALLTALLLLAGQYHLPIVIAQVHSMVICVIFIYILFVAHTKSPIFRVHLSLLAIGILIFSSSVIAYLLAENGVITMNFITENSIVLGSFFEVVFSTATIVLYQKSLKDRLQLLTINQNTLLKQKVEERTRELAMKNERLADMIVEKENLVSIIAHDLKSPLNQTKALSQLVQNEIEKNPVEAMNLTKHIEKVSGHGLTLIKELFDATLLETNQEQIMFTSIDLKELSREVIHNFTPISQKKNIELQFTFNSEVIIYSYPPYVVRIIENILSNAIKFSPAGAKVEISVQDLHSRGMVSIKDQGPGFHEQDKQRMFKKFQKLTATPTAGESSNGLGLYIIKTLASRVNAMISVESEFGKGTVFTFSFPKL